ncbi:MAG: DUF4249 family protein [Candidatus Kapabacteria bacterium]|jgi:hypothetical protein|nr:DUF4249 family protein [Candidatus Kapabacteria bacterium]
MKKINKTILAALMSLLILGLNSCEDDPPATYQPKTFVEAILIVDEPIRNLKLQASQRVGDVIDYGAAMIRDAEITIYEGDQVFPISVSQDVTDESGYYYEDQTYLVKPGTEYRIEITLSDGTFISGKTTTPNRTEWVIPADDVIQFPKDTVNYVLDDSVNTDIEWTKVEGVKNFLLSVKCLDTEEYGIYNDDIPDSEMNRKRVGEKYNEEEDGWKYYETSFWGYIPLNKFQIIWRPFKWFGQHELAIFAPDPNFLKWFYQSSWAGNYESVLTTIDGAAGVFGSASAVRDTFFLLKNQP